MTEEDRSTGADFAADLRNAWEGGGDTAVGYVVPFGDGDAYFDVDAGDWVVILWKKDGTGEASRHERVAVYEGECDPREEDGVRFDLREDALASHEDRVFLVGLDPEEEPVAILETYGTGLRLVWDSKDLPDYNLERSRRYLQGGGGDGDG